MINEDILKKIQLISSGTSIDDSDDITELYSILLYHRCFYLLSKIKSVNPIVLNIKALIAKNKLITKERYEKCSKFFREMETSNIRYAVYKGAVLSSHAYGDPNYRNSFDIDLIIKKDDITKIKKILYNMDFIQGRIIDNEIKPFSRSELIFHTSMTHQSAPFVLKTESHKLPFVNIDLNFNIIWREAKKSIDIDFLLDQTENFDIYGASVKVLPIVIDFIAVCLHHYKDTNSIYQIYNGKFKLCIYTDIYYYLKNNIAKLTPNLLSQICEKLQVTEYIYYCVYHANMIFQDELILPYIKILETPNGIYLTDKFGLDEYEQKTWNMDFMNRLFNKDFKNEFMLQLTDSDKEKIHINTEMMM